MGKHTHSIQGVDPTSTGTTHLAFVGEHLYGGSVTVDEVQVEQVGAADADWNVTLDGNDLFSSEQSASAAGTPEVLVPDQNRNAAGNPLELAVNVSSAGTGSALNVTVVTDDNKGD